MYFLITSQLAVGLLLHVPLVQLSVVQALWSSQSGTVTVTVDAAHKLTAPVELSTV